MNDNLVDVFCELAAIPSPSMHESAVAEYLKRQLDSMGVSYTVDDSQQLTKSDTGNIIVKVGSGKPALLFVAHMDTVEDGKSPVTPVVKDGVISSDGSTIVGSDDKAGVTAMLGAIKELKDAKDIPTVYFAFSTAEEGGDVPMGAAYLKFDSDIDYAFSVDGSDSPGKFITKSLGYQGFKIAIRGKSAHAASRPETGADAIKAAGIIISKLDIGKDDKGASISVHGISGNATTDATVPDNAELRGTFRGFSQDDMGAKLKHIKATAEAACNSTGCTYEMTMKPSDSAPPFSLESSGILKLAEEASRASGLEFSTFTLYSPSEANVLSGMGYTTLGMCRGGRDAHSVKEHLYVKELDETKRLIMEIVKSAKQHTE